MTIQRPGNLGNLKRRGSPDRRHGTRADAGLGRCSAPASHHLPRPGPPRRGVPGLPLLQHRAATAHPAAPRPAAHSARRRYLTPRHHGGDPASVASPETTSSVVATLTAQLTDLRRRHREEIARLRRELEAAHGENLLLRRRLAAGHDPGNGNL